MDAGRGVIRRQALFARLSAVRDGGVVLVCAPAGSGKSVLVDSWVQTEGLEDRVAWVSVERGEHDEQRFLLTLVNRLAEVEGAVDQATFASNFRGEVVLARLLSELSGLAQPLVLVVDDLHELRSPQAMVWLERLLAQRPPRLLVVLVTRQDPGLGLHRLRLAGELTELRGPDLRLSLLESGQLLTDAGVRLSPSGLALLDERTEGWAAGVRLAAISLSRHPEPERFVAEFSGAERNVAGYLLAEVLERQPAEVRELLLRTSVLDRVSGSLGDYLTGGSGSERILQQLEDANVFVTSLDIGRSWFRYHKLFAELLQLELRRTAPASIASLHRAAAQWHEHNGHIVEAIRHAQAGKDWSTATRLVAEHHTSLLLDGQIVTLRELANAFPSSLPAEDAELALAFAAIRVSAGALEDGGQFTDLAAHLADTFPVERRPRFDAQMALVTLSLSRRHGELDRAMEAMRFLEAALAMQPPNERPLGDELRAAALQNLGVAELWSSRVVNARRDLEQALALARRAGRPYIEIGCLGYLAIAGPATALPLLDALKLAEEAVAIAEECAWTDQPVGAPGLGAGAIALVCMGRFDEAEEWLARAESSLHGEPDAGTEAIVHYARGLLCQATGRTDQALTAFRAAQEIQALLASEHLISATAHARLLQTQSQVGEIAAARVALEGLNPQERGRGPMRVATALVDLAEGNPEEATERLAPVIEQSAPALHNSLLAIEALVLDAVARGQLRDHRTAEASLERALELAEPDGIVLPFLVLPVQDLLESYPPHRSSHATLLRTIQDVRAGSSARPRGSVPPLLEELTETELRVVRYLPSNLKVPEIASELYLSANTVRTHIRHIYGKLDAHDRNQAVARARELGLLARSR